MMDIYIVADKYCLNELRDRAEYVLDHFMSLGLYEDDPPYTRAREALLPLLMMEALGERQELFKSFMSRVVTWVLNLLRRDEQSVTPAEELMDEYPELRKPVRHQAVLTIKSMEQKKAPTVSFHRRGKGVSSA